MRCANALEFAKRLVREPLEYAFRNVNKIPIRLLRSRFAPRHCCANLQWNVLIDTSLRFYQKIFTACCSNDEVWCVEREATRICDIVQSQRLWTSILAKRCNIRCL